MDEEIELKLLVSPDAGKDLKSGFIDKLESAYTYNSSLLYNSYFDTPDKELQGLRMACRVRGEDGQFEQTIKTAGKSTGGLALRPEHNVSIEGNKPDLRLFTDLEWPKDVSIGQLQEELICLFDTQFERDTYLICLDEDTKVECVFDSGVIETAKHQEPICEIELELKKGHPAHLISLARQLLDVFPFRLGTQSKAQRGYRLVDGQRLSRQKLSDRMAQHGRGSLEEVLLVALQDALGYWQHCEQFYLEENKLRELYGITKILSFLQFICAHFGKQLECIELETLASKISEVRLHWNWAEEVESIRELRSIKGAFRKKLANNEPLMKNLKELLNGLCAQHSPEQLFLKKDYVGIQLDILQLMVEKPWRKHNSEYKKSIVKVAPKWIEQSISKIKLALNSKQSLSIPDYLRSESLFKEVGILDTFLGDNVFQMANLNNINWRNILDGIIDLKTLQVLESYLEVSKLDERDSLLKWCRKKQSYTLALMDED